MSRSRRAQPMTPPPASALVDIYARYSSDMQDGVTLITQVAHSRKRAEGHGWIVRRVWEEPETSAKYDVEDLAKRPQFAAMLAAAQRGECQAILCFKSDRWARNVGMSSKTLQDLRRWGVWWETADGEFDSERIRRGAGKLTHTIKAALDEQYVDTVSDHSAAGKATRAGMGYSNASIAPFGYLPPAYPPRPEGAPALWKPPRTPWGLDEARAPITLLAGELFADGMSYSEIAAELNRRGLRRHVIGHRALKYFAGQNEIPWTKEGVYALLRCVAYREFAPGTGNGTIVAPDGSHVAGLHPSIWPYTLWQRIEAQKAARRWNGHSPARVGPRYPFTGVITCAGCQMTMRSSTVGKQRYHECLTARNGGECFQGRHASNARVIENAFGHLLRAYRLGDTWRDDLQALVAEDDHDDARERIAAERAGLEREQKTLNTMFRAGGMEEDEYMRELAGVKRRIAALPTPPVHSETTAMHAGETLASLPEAWAAATLAEQHTIVTSLLRRLVWSHDTQSIAALEPLDEYLPSLTLILAAHDWQRDGATLVCQHADPAIAPAQMGGVLSLAQQVDIYQRHHQGGVPIAELAREYGVHNATIWRIAHKPRRDLRTILGVGQ